ncbi:MAG: hypothetical protein BYD32DRAFT_426174 [Podila humilis]|nr:MAG: hypothetical protein BYD32DRAFT_426174 [Podila humilis]
MGCPRKPVDELKKVGSKECPKDSGKTEACLSSKKKVPRGDLQTDEILCHLFHTSLS